jgi:hypothetical protein
LDSLSLDFFQLTTTVNRLDASFTGSISDEFVATVGGVSINVAPFIQLYLEVENTAVPFDVILNPSALSELSFGGNFTGLVVMSVPEIPASVSLQALSPDIVNCGLVFELGLDIDLVPIEDGELLQSTLPYCVTSYSYFTLFSIEIISVLNELSALSYPEWLENVASYLPAIDLECVANSGIGYLNKAVANSDAATVSGLLDAIDQGCSASTLSCGGDSGRRRLVADDSPLHQIGLSGGYNSESQELEINIVVMLGGKQSV